MTGKSKRKRGKQHPSRKGRTQQRAATRAAAPPPAPVEAVTQPEVAPPPVATSPPQSARPQAIRFPYITTELRTIGALAGIMLIVLIILYFTLT